MYTLFGDILEAAEMDGDLSRKFHLIVGLAYCTIHYAPRGPSRFAPFSGL
jgi:hypothetical protein